MFDCLAGSFLQRSPSTCSQGRDVTPSVDRSTSVTSATESDCELLLQPLPLLRMDSKGERSTSGDTVTLAQVRCHGENLFIQVETTAPAPKRRSKRCKRLRFEFRRHFLLIKYLNTTKGFFFASGSGRVGTTTWQVLTLRWRRRASGSRRRVARAATSCRRKPPNSTVARNFRPGFAMNCARPSDLRLRQRLAPTTRRASTPWQTMTSVRLLPEPPEPQRRKKL